MVYRGFRQVTTFHWSTTYADIVLQWGEWSVFRSDGYRLIDDAFPTVIAAIDAYYQIEQSRAGRVIPAKERTMKHMMNLTPHNVDIHGDEGFIVTVQPSGTAARVAEQRESCPPVQIGTDISGLYIPVSRATYGAVQGLPASDGETIYIVSSLVLAQCAGRTDVFAPGPAIRDDAGRQIGCHGLSAAPAAQTADPLAKLAAWVARRADWRLVITGTDTGVEVATRYPDGSDHCLGSGPTLAHAAAACLAELMPDARATVPVIDSIIDDVYWALVGSWTAGGNGGAEPTRDEAARLLRGLDAVGWERAEQRERAAVEAHHA